jgi:membrane protein
MLGHELVLIVVAAVLFAAMFKFLPDAKIRWRDVAFGAVITAVLFVAGKFAIGFYLGASNLADAYGAASSLVLILVWVYYSSMIFLLGAEFTQAWARWQGRRIQPEEGAAHVIEKEEKVPS